MKIALTIIGFVFSLLFGAIWHEGAQPLLFLLVVAGIGAFLFVIGFFTPLTKESYQKEHDKTL